MIAEIPKWVEILFLVVCPFQKFGFEQPNKAITYFPFILLPALIVPLVIWTHLSDILKLIFELKTNFKSQNSDIVSPK